MPWRDPPEPRSHLLHPAVRHPAWQLQRFHEVDSGHGAGGCDPRHTVLQEATPRLQRIVWKL
jgi:hypothetical protein